MDGTDKFLWDLAWKHFAYHAEQRLKAFNFFIVAETFIFAGALAALQSGNVPEVGVIAGVMLFFMSWIFYGLDQRNRHLVKLAENTLIQLERKYPCVVDDPPGRIGLFSSEIELSDDSKGRQALTYNQSIRAFYLLSAGIGILAIGYSLCGIMA